MKAIRNLLCTSQTTFFFPYWKMQAKWQGLLAIECPDKYARFLANGIIKNSHNASKTWY